MYNKKKLNNKVEYIDPFLYIENKFGNSSFPIILKNFLEDLLMKKILKNFKQFLLNNYYYDLESYRGFFGV